MLFNLTVAENIRLGAPGASAEDVEAAARAANAHGFVEALPEGYATRLGEGGIQLSGGQKQRIAIARAVVRNPKVCYRAGSRADPCMSSAPFPVAAGGDIQPFTARPAVPPFFPCPAGPASGRGHQRVGC